MHSPPAWERRPAAAGHDDEASPAPSDGDSDGDGESGRRVHRLRGQPPLLPPRMATLVSTVSGATRLSLEITSLFWEAVFETIADSTTGGRLLGTAAWQEAKAATLAVAGVFAPLSSLNPRIVSRIVGSTTAAGYAMVNRSLEVTGGLMEGGLALSAKAVGLGLHAAGEYVRFIDAVFGSTDTSRVLASFVHMVRRETLDNNPEVRALIKEHGLVSFISQVLKTVVAWICLQVVTHGRTQPYRMELVYSNMHPGSAFCPRRYVAATGASIPLRTPPRSPTPHHISPMIFHADRLRESLAVHASAAAEAQSPTLGPARARSATVDVPMLHISASDASDSDGDGDGAIYALSDQESIYVNKDHGAWDRRLVEALGHPARQTPIPRDGDSSSAGESDSEDGARLPAPLRNRSSIWTAIHTVREAAAAAAAKEHDTGDGSTLSSEDDQSPLARPVLPRNSAPASLVPSPQPSGTPAADVSPAQPRARPRAAAADAVPPLGALPSVIEPIVDVSVWPAEPAQLQQEFPPRPLLFNLARFISIASSAYGRRFMQVIGMDNGMIDARALIDAFSDPDPLDPGAATGGLSRPGSTLSMGAGDRSAYASPRMGATLGLAMPRLAALPLGPSPRRAGRESRPETPSGRRTPGRRPRPRHAYAQRRPMSEHPNHFCFAKHAGIPLGDLLFSSYVSPIVPGVSRAAHARASAVERKLRHKRSLSVAAAAAAKKPPPPAAAADNPSADSGGKCWLGAVPVLGPLWNRLPSPMSALSRVPAIPGMVARTLGLGAAAATAAVVTGEADTRRPDDDAAQTPRGPTQGQFRRFDRIRRRLVYRNPSIHALVHYIAVDHATRSVVLACRGTLGISDLFIDMLCEYEAVSLPAHAAAMAAPTELRAHSGMWHSALLLADPSSEVFKEVAEALRLYPEYGLVITGHSLGGGVASLLTLLWSQPLFSAAEGAASPPGPARALPASLAGSARRFVTTAKFGLVAPRPIHCFSYGSPCSTNAALSYYCRGLVTSVATTDDFVSFLSVGAFVDILNISAVLGRERGVTERVMRGFLAAQRSKISKRFRLFDFDFSKLRAYDPDPDPSSDSESVRGGSNDDDSSSTSTKDDAARGQKRWWWSYKTNHSNTRGAGHSSPPHSPGASTPPSEDAGKAKQSSLDDWYLSLVKTLRASMDSEKLYPPGDVFILASPGDDEIADKKLPLAASALPPADDDGPLPVGLFYCPDVAARFSELRFTRNMIVHHLPSTYERKLSALVHDTYFRRDAGAAS